MDLGIKNKRVLITGGSNGIGEELAYQFAKEVQDNFNCQKRKKIKKYYQKNFLKKKRTSFLCR